MQMTVIGIYSKFLNYHNNLENKSKFLNAANKIPNHMTQLIFLTITMAIYA